MDVPQTVKEKPALSQRYRVRVYGQWCKGCGLCIAFCPQKVFTEGEENRPVASHPERCVGCHWCTDHCPDFAIVVTKVESEAGK